MAAFFPTEMAAPNPRLVHHAVANWPKMTCNLVALSKPNHPNHKDTIGTWYDDSQGWGKDTSLCTGPATGCHMPKIQHQTSFLRKGPGLRIYRGFKANSIAHQMDAHRCNPIKQGFQELPEGWLPTLVHLALHSDSDPEFFINRSSTMTNHDHASSCPPW